LERIEPQVDQDRPIDLDRPAKPAPWLIDEAVLEVVDPYRAERRFGEIEDLVTLRWPLAGEHVRLVVAVEVDLVRRASDVLPLLELVGDVGVAGGGDECREPVEPREYPIFDLPGGHLSWPADDCWQAEATFHHRPLATGKRRLAPVGPGEVLRPIVRA